MCALWKDAVLAGSKRQAVTSHAPATLSHLKEDHYGHIPYSHFLNCFLVLELAGATMEGGSSPGAWSGMVAFERWRIREKATKAIKVLTQIQFYWKLGFKDGF